MELLSIGSLAAALTGALLSIVVFLFLPRVKALPGTRHYLAYLTVGLSVAVALLSFVSLQVANRSNAPPGDVTVVATAAPNIPASAATPAPPPPLPKRITVVVPFSEVLDEHSNLLGTTTRQYTRRFPAQDGFRIVEAKFTEKSATRVGDFSVQTTDQEAIVSFRLTSGPSVDRYRGWLHGDLTLVQEEVIRRP